MIKTAQDLARIRAGAADSADAGNVATVAAVYTDGVTLILPGQTAAGEKHYPCAAGTSFVAGQRVYFNRDGNTKVVLCGIGKPSTGGGEGGGETGSEPDPITNIEIENMFGGI